MENNPYLANGFNNSFTKKRFIMMKNKCHIRFTTLRRALILPFFIGIFSLLCFTTGQSQVKYKAKNTSKSNLQAESYLKDSMDVTLDTVNSMHFNATFTPDSIKMILPNNNTLSLGAGNLNKQQIDKALNDCSTQTALALKELDKIIRNNSKSIKNEDLNLIFKNLDMNGGGKNLGQLPFSDKFLSSITKDDLKSFQANLYNLKVNVDKLKNESSSLTKMEGFSHQLMSLFENQLFSKIFSEAMQMSMPKFESNPQTHKVIETIFSNGTTTKVYDNGSTSTTTKIIPSQELSQEQKERKELDDKLWREARRLKSDEFVISDIPFTISNERKIVSIEKSLNETKVTIAIPIHNDQMWIYFSSGLTIVDKNTKDRYIVRRVENKLPLNQTLIVTGCGRKMIEITEVFPPLKSSVELIDILTLTNYFPNMMSNRGPHTEFRNVSISDYSKKTVGKVYR